MEHSWFSVRMIDGVMYPGICLGCSIHGEDETTKLPCPKKNIVPPIQNILNGTFDSIDNKE